jgi:very-short-patch-repair endonuclease
MGGHSNVCSKNPNRLKGVGEKIHRSLKCSKCSSEYVVKITERSFQKGKYSKFCSNRCAKSRVQTKETKERISKTLLIHYDSYGMTLSKIRYVNCNICDSTFIIKENSRRKYCSRACSLKASGLGSKENWKNPDYRKMMIEKFCNRENSGFKPGNTKYYSEEWVLNYLSDKISLSRFKIQYKVRQRDLGLDSPNNYYVDFYFPESNHILEIDGSQHKYSDYIEKDIKRDSALIKAGYKITRIDWCNIKDAEKLSDLKEKLDLFINEL